MGLHVTKEQIRNARVCDFYGFLVERYPHLFSKEGNFLRMKEHKSLVVRRGFPGYVRNSNGEHGNAVDFLVRYLGYSFNDAVVTLANSDETVLMADISSVAKREAKEVVFNEPNNGDVKRLYAYLIKGRGISPDTVRGLCKSGLIYQDVKGNAVFINRERTFCEIRGTLTGVKYSRTFSKRKDPEFWYFRVGSKCERAYICEGAIDAISLYELLKMEGRLETPSMFVGMGGVSKQKVIDKVTEMPGVKVVLAVDNDKAGKECREKNLALEALVPEEKDWNEDLLKRRGIVK